MDEKKKSFYRSLTLGISLLSNTHTQLRPSHCEILFAKAKKVLLNMRFSFQLAILQSIQSMTLEIKNKQSKGSFATCATWKQEARFLLVLSITAGYILLKKLVLF